MSASLTLDQLIAKLQECRSKVGGDTEVGYAPREGTAHHFRIEDVCMHHSDVLECDFVRILQHARE